MGTSDKKPLLVLGTTVLDQGDCETGMGFFVAPGKKPGTAYAVLSDGATLPLQSHDRYYDVTDLLAGALISARAKGSVSLGSATAHRAAAAALMSALSVSSAYSGGVGAFPLISSFTITSPATFYRFLQASKDHRFKGGDLLAGTYLTTQLELPHVNSGFAAVGRFALPLPLPACHVFKYELPAGTTLLVGTVAPLFGQAGGGVEVLLQARQSATLLGSFVLPAS